MSRSVLHERRPVRPLGVGERLVVRSVVTRLGTKSFTVRQELVQDDQVTIRAEAVMVAFDFAADASRPLSDDEKAHWAAFVEI